MKVRQGSDANEAVPPPPGSPGLRALGAMAAAAQRARAASGSPSGLPPAAAPAPAPAPTSVRAPEPGPAPGPHAARANAAPEPPRGGRLGRRRPRPGGGRCPGRDTGDGDRRWGQPRLAGSSFPRTDDHRAQDGAGPSPPDHRRPHGRDVHHDDHGPARCGQRSTCHRLPQPGQRERRSGHPDRRVQLLELLRPNRGHVQRPGGADQLSRAEHLQRHRAALVGVRDRAGCPSPRPAARPTP